jgi:hypothetical protein
VFDGLRVITAISSELVARQRNFVLERCQYAIQEVFKKGVRFLIFGMGDGTSLRKAQSAAKERMAHEVISLIGIGKQIVNLAHSLQIRKNSKQKLKAQKSVLDFILFLANLGDERFDKIATDFAGHCLAKSDIFSNSFLF